MPDSTIVRYRAEHGRQSWLAAATPADPLFILAMDRRTVVWARRCSGSGTMPRTPPRPLR